MPTAYGSIGICRDPTPSAPSYGAAATNANARVPTVTVWPNLRFYATAQKATAQGQTQSKGVCKLPDTKLLGTTSILSVLTGNHKVYAYDRLTGRIVRMARSDAAGAFTIKGLPVAADRYFVVLVQDPADSGSYNLDALDHLTQS